MGSGVGLLARVRLGSDPSRNLSKPGHCLRLYAISLADSCGISGLFVQAWPRQLCWLMWVPVFLGRGVFCEENEEFVSGALGDISMWGLSVVGAATKPLGMMVAGWELNCPECPIFNGSRSRGFE